jgi:hypothetical protein
MPNLLDPFESLEFLFGVPDKVIVFGAEVAVDDLDSFEDAAGRFALPDFAEAPGTEAVEEPVSRNGFGVRLEADGHRTAPSRGEG